LSQTSVESLDYNACDLASYLVSNQSQPDSPSRVVRNGAHLFAFDGN